MSELVCDGRSCLGFYFYKSQQNDRRVKSKDNCMSHVMCLENILYYVGGNEIFRPSGLDLGPTQTLVFWVPGLSRE